MVLQNVLSMCLFAFFILMVLIRAAMLRKRGIRVMLFGQTNKSDFLLMPLFAISRNPIYVCFLTFFMGLFLINCNIVISMAIVLFALAIHRQIIREEKFLARHYGSEYDTYQKKVRRYL